jgi:hypothetical protein
LGHRPILEKKIFGSRSPPFGHPLGLSLLMDLLMEKKGQKSEPSTVRWTGENKGWWRGLPAVKMEAAWQKRTLGSSLNREHSLRMVGLTVGARSAFGRMCGLPPPLARPMAR